VSIKDYEFNDGQGGKIKRKVSYWGTGWLFQPGIVKTAYHVVFHNIWDDSVKKTDVQIYLVRKIEIFGNDMKITGYPLTINYLEKKKDVVLLKIEKFFDTMFNNEKSENSDFANTEMNQFVHPLNLSKNIPAKNDDIYAIGFKPFSTGIWERFIFRVKLEERKINISDGYIDVEAIVVSGLIDNGASGGVIINSKGEVIATIIKTVANGRIVGVLVDNISK
jgi:hypothetical protein